MPRPANNPTATAASKALDDAVFDVIVGCIENNLGMIDDATLRARFDDAALALDVMVAELRAIGSERTRADIRRDAIGRVRRNRDLPVHIALAA